MASGIGFNSCFRPRSKNLRSVLTLSDDGFWAVRLGGRDHLLDGMRGRAPGPELRGPGPRGPPCGRARVPGRRRGALVETLATWLRVPGSRRGARVETLATWLQASCKAPASRRGAHEAKKDRSSCKHANRPVDGGRSALACHVSLRPVQRARHGDLASGPVKVCKVMGFAHGTHRHPPRASCHAATRLKEGGVADETCQGCCG